jgi:hypothetical protein
MGNTSAVSTAIEAIRTNFAVWQKRPRMRRSRTFFDALRDHWRQGRPAQESLLADQQQRAQAWSRTVRRYHHPSCFLAKTKNGGHDATVGILTDNTVDAARRLVAEGRATELEGFTVEESTLGAAAELACAMLVWERTGNVAGLRSAYVKQASFGDKPGRRDAWLPPSAAVRPVDD